MPRICLIGEHDPFIARLLQRFGQESGLQTVHARVGEEVLALARELKPAVIILEPELPGKVRGWEAVAALRGDGELCDIPVITCAWLCRPDAERLAGVSHGFLQKPDLHYADFLAALMDSGLEIDLSAA